MTYISHIYRIYSIKIVYISNISRLSHIYRIYYIYITYIEYTSHIYRINYIYMTYFTYISKNNINIFHISSIFKSIPFIWYIYRIDMPITLSNRQFMGIFTGQIQFARNINQQQSLTAPHEQQWAQVTVKL